MSIGLKVQFLTLVLLLRSSVPRNKNLKKKGGEDTRIAWPSFMVV